MGFGNTLLAGHGADVFDRDEHTMADISPIRHLSKHLPPTLLVVGDGDFPMLAGDAKAFAMRAHELGLTVPVLTAKKHAHGTVPMVLIRDEEELAPRLLAFLGEPARFLTQWRVESAAPQEPGK